MARSAAVVATTLAGEEPIEDEPRIDLLGHRRGRGSPGDVGGVRTAITRVAVARLGASIAAKLQRWKPSRLPDLLCGDLVDRDADADVGAVGLERMRAGQEAGERPSVVAAAVAVGAALSWARPLKTSRSFLNGLERVEDDRKLEVGPSFSGVQSCM